MSEQQFTAKQTARAERAAIRLRDKVYRFPIATLILVICAVANLAINCWRARYGTAEQAHEEIVRRCSTPEGKADCMRQLAKIVWHHSSVWLWWGQAEEIAGAMLDEYLDSQPEMLCVMRGED